MAPSFISLSAALPPGPRERPGVTSALSHLPLVEAAIDQSVTELVETLPEAPPSEGYAVWRVAFDDGEAGVFTVPLGQRLELTEQSMSTSA